MLKKSITYKDFNEIERTEVFRFHLSEAEIIEMEMEQDGGLEAHINRIVAGLDGAAIIKFFKKFIRLSYGEISEDGRHFMKSEEISDAFICSAAYPVLFAEFMEGGDAATNFVNGLLPKKKKAT